MASSVADKSLSSRTFAPATTTASDPPSASTKRERFTPFLSWSVGLGPMRSPKARLAHHTVRRLPVPIDPLKLLALLEEGCPDLIQNSKLDLPLQSVMHGGIVGEFFGKAVPLAAGA